MLNELKIVSIIIYYEEPEAAHAAFSRVGQWPIGKNPVKTHTQTKV